MTISPNVYTPWLLAVSPDDLRRIVDALYRVHRFLVVITDLDVLLESIMEESKHVAQAEACSLLLYDSVAEELYFEVALGESGDQQALKRMVRLKLNQGIAGAAASSRQTVNVPDVHADPRFYGNADETSHFKTHSLLAVPLVDRDKLVGVLEVVNKVGGGPFTEIDNRIMEMFSGLVASAIANARLIDENLRAERLAAIGQAIAGLSHYTKNIITGMSGSVDLIDQGLERDNQEIVRRSWPVFKRCTKRIANFVEDMLAFSKPRTPVLETCLIAEVIDDAVQTFRETLVRKEIQLHVDYSQATQPVRIETQGVYRVLLNLMINASEAVPKQGGFLRIEARQAESGDLFLEVADNGPGVPDILRRKIFEPFFSTKGTQGTGLGLAVTRKLIHEHGGDIEIDRSPEGGALFRIRIPMAPQPKPESSHGKEAVREI
ncbi:MAG: ATP-binding protein [Candidatus Hydrogenedentales bacterium]